MMKRNIAYWATTALVGAVTLFAGVSYLTAAPEAVENFRHVGYPQQLRVLLGIGKLAGAIVPAPATAADVEGMGLRRLYLHVDRGSRGALSGRRRRLVLAARRADRVAGGVVRHAPGESPRFREPGVSVEHAVRSRVRGLDDPTAPDREEHRVSRDVEGPHKRHTNVVRDPDNGNEMSATDACSLSDTVFARADRAAAVTGGK